MTTERPTPSIRERHNMRVRTSIVGLIAVLSLLAACTAGDDAEPTATDDSSGSSTTQSIPTGPSPGVTDDSIKVGVTYVDLKGVSPRSSTSTTATTRRRSRC